MIFNGSSSWGPTKTTPIEDIERVKREVLSKWYTLVEVDYSGDALPDRFHAQEKYLAWQPCIECSGRDLVEETRYERHSGMLYREYVTRWCEECGIAR